MSGLLGLLREHEGAIEADLARWYRIDYRDRWRGNLTLRRIYVLVRHLPPDSAVGNALRTGKPHWTLEAHLLDDLRLSLTGSKERPPKPHPLRPKPTARKMTPERARKLAAARKRARERRRQIEAGELE